MRIRMIETRRGTTDGKTVRQYFRGEDYDLPEFLARAFLAAGHAMPLFYMRSKLQYFRKLP